MSAIARTSILALALVYGLLGCTAKNPPCPPIKPSPSPCPPPAFSAPIFFCDDQGRIGLYDPSACPGQRVSHLLDLRNEPNVFGTREFTLAWDHAKQLLYAADKHVYKKNHNDVNEPFKHRIFVIDPNQSPAIVVDTLLPLAGGSGEFAGAGLIGQELFGVFSRESRLVSHDLSTSPPTLNKDPFPGLVFPEQPQGLGDEGGSLYVGSVQQDPGSKLYRIWFVQPGATHPSVVANSTHKVHDIDVHGPDLFVIVSQGTERDAGLLFLRRSDGHVAQYVPHFELEAGVSGLARPSGVAVRAP